MCELVESVIYTTKENIPLEEAHSDELIDKHDDDNAEYRNDDPAQLGNDAKNERDNLQ